MILIEVHFCSEVLTYEEGPGEHVWAYWDKMIQSVLAWMLPV